jgi:hypothetical protein
MRAARWETVLPSFGSFHAGEERNHEAVQVHDTRRAANAVWLSASIRCDPVADFVGCSVEPSSLFPRR